MAWCCQGTSYYLSQCWPRSMSPCGIAGPQCVHGLWAPRFSCSSHPKTYWQKEYFALTFSNEFPWKKIIMFSFKFHRRFSLKVQWWYVNKYGTQDLNGLKANGIKPIKMHHHQSMVTTTGIILSVRPTNKGRRYIVTSSLIGWVHTQNYPCPSKHLVIFYKAGRYKIYDIDI